MRLDAPDRPGLLTTIRPIPTWSRSEQFAGAATHRYVTGNARCLRCPYRVMPRGLNTESPITTSSTSKAAPALGRQFGPKPTEIATGQVRLGDDIGQKAGWSRVHHQQERGRNRQQELDQNPVVPEQAPTRAQRRIADEARCGQHEAGRAAHLIKVAIPKDSTTTASLEFKLDRAKLRQVRRREGHYLLRTNLAAQDPAWLWTFYIQLTEVEQAFKELKHDLAVRPTFHRNEDRIEAHIFVAFLAYCLQVTLKASAGRLRHLALTTRASRIFARSPCSVPPRMRFVFLDSRLTLHASFPRSVALTQLRFTSLTVVSSREDLHLQDCAHAGRTNETRGARPRVYFDGWRSGRGSNPRPPA